jgi:Leucine-rich repeat (LRR) protein
LALTGPIPTEFGKLINLQILELGGNKLTGTVRFFCAFDLVSTRVSVRRPALKTSFIATTGPIPTELGKSSSLTRLCLANNQLTGTTPRLLICAGCFVT